MDKQRLTERLNAAFAELDEAERAVMVARNSVSTLVELWREFVDPNGYPAWLSGS